MLHFPEKKCLKIAKIVNNTKNLNEIKLLVIIIMYLVIIYEMLQKITSPIFLRIYLNLILKLKRKRKKSFDDQRNIN